MCISVCYKYLVLRCFYHNFPDEGKQIFFLFFALLFCASVLITMPWFRSGGGCSDEGPEKRRRLNLWGGGGSPFVSEGFQLTKHQSGLLTHSFRYKPKVFSLNRCKYEMFLRIHLFYCCPFITKQLCQLLFYMQEFSKCSFVC
jgi:hypothetical protein